MRIEQTSSHGTTSYWMCLHRPERAPQARGQFRAGCEQGVELLRQSDPITINFSKASMIDHIHPITQTDQPFAERLRRTPHWLQELIGHFDDKIGTIV